MVGGVDVEFVVEDVVPDLLHVVPVRDDAVLHRVFKSVGNIRSPDVLALIQNRCVCLLGIRSTNFWTW